MDWQWPHQIALPATGPQLPDDPVLLRAAVAAPHTRSYRRDDQDMIVSASRSALTQSKRRDREHARGLKQTHTNPRATPRANLPSSILPADPHLLCARALLSDRIKAILKK